MYVSCDRVAFLGHPCCLPAFLFNSSPPDSQYRRGCDRPDLNKATESWRLRSEGPENTLPTGSRPHRAPDPGSSEPSQGSRAPRPGNSCWGISTLPLETRLGNGRCMKVPEREGVVPDALVVERAYHASDIDLSPCRIEVRSVNPQEHFRRLLLGGRWLRPESAMVDLTPSFVHIYQQAQ